MSDRITVRLSDPDTSDALDRAAEEIGSKSKAIRRAIRREYAADPNPEPAVPDELPTTAIRGLRALSEHAGDAARIEVEQAKALVANETNTPKDAVRSEVFEPLRREGLIRASPQIHAAFIVINHHLQ